MIHMFEKTSLYLKKKIKFLFISGITKGLTFK